MKVILLQDVAKLGRRHSVVEVPDGRALNQLMPRKLAVPATPENLKRIEAQFAHDATTAKAAESRFIAACKQLKDVTLLVTVTANKEGHLFQAVKPSEVVAAAGVQGVVLEDSEVSFAAPIKMTGEHTVTLVHGDHHTPLSIEVKAK